MTRPVFSLGSQCSDFWQSAGPESVGTALGVLQLRFVAAAAKFQQMSAGLPAFPDIDAGGCGKQTGLLKCPSQCNFVSSSCILRPQSHPFSWSPWHISLYHTLSGFPYSPVCLHIRLKNAQVIQTNKFLWLALIHPTSSPSLSHCVYMGQELKEVSRRFLEYRQHLSHLVLFREPWRDIKKASKQQDGGTKACLLYYF